MKKILSKILPVLVLLLIVGVALVPEVSRAWLEGPIQEVVNGLFARLSNIILTLASYLVLISGIFLNQSINLTTHIGDIFNSIPALQEIWIIVRNLSSIFIIFMLLYSSITTILGVDGPSMKNLIKNIVMAGLLINFSLFFVKIGIDASNLVSLQFYRAIAPGASESTRIGDSFTAPGLSNVFMSSLKIPKIYQNNGITKGIDVTASIGLATVMGTIVMITAALSFFAASIMFSIRTAILIFVMALSPIFFAGMIFPAIKKEVSDKLFGILKNQLIFMPAYLFLMYVALKFISSKGFEEIFNAGTGTGGGPLGIIFIGVIIQYVIALLFINAPLVFAIQLGGIGAKWVPGSKNIWDVAQGFGGVVGRNTAGRLSRGLGNTFDNLAVTAQGNAVGRAASSVLRNIGVSQTVRGSLTNLEKNKYGSSQSLDDVKKDDKDRSRVISGLQRTKTQMASIETYMNAHKKGVPPTPLQEKAFRDSVSSMDTKELENLRMETLTDPKFAAHIPTSKIDALMKSDALTTQQQQDLKKAREAGLEEIVNPASAPAGSGADNLINVLLKGKPQDIAKLPSKIITQREVAKLLDPAMLRKMVDENVSKADRDTIRTIIESYTVPPPIPGSTLDKSQRYLATNFVF